MKDIASFAWAVLRMGYGAFFLGTGLWIVSTLLTGLTSPPRQPTASAAAFMQALSATGFMDYLLAASFALGGASLLFDRTAPAGLTILAPSVAVIFFFHLLLSGQWAVGSVVALVFVALIWHYRQAFEKLLTGKA